MSLNASSELKKTSMSDAIISTFYPEVVAGGFTRRDGTVAFYTRVQALLRPEDHVLDFGAGRGAAHYIDNSQYRKRLRDLRGEGRYVVGADIDSVVFSNPWIDEAVVLKPDATLPFGEEAFDIIVSDSTFEHIRDSTRVASELGRVLKSGGWLCARTPNRNGYVALANRVCTARSADRILSLAQPDRRSEDVFPAFYRMNSPLALRALFPLDRYDHATYAFDSEPRYYFNRRSMFALMLMLQAVTPSFFKNVLLCFIRKR
jgi:SAM-dependent methyltransferase